VKFLGFICGPLTVPSRINIKVSDDRVSPSVTTAVVGGGFGGWTPALQAFRICEDTGAEFHWMVRMHECERGGQFSECWLFGW